MEKPHAELELYIHIPFCARKCNYCDFLSFSCHIREHDAYISKLCEEIRLAAPLYAQCQISSIFIGGGTPSLLEPRHISKIMFYLRRYYRLLPHAEISIECNPASTLRYKFSAYRDAGINRISIGLQSANNDELKALGRLHSFEEFLKCYQGARLEGFQNINIDLINGIPGQSAQSWKNTLKKVTMLKPEHLSIYNLIVEEGTPFHRMQAAGQLSLPDENLMAEIDLLTKEFTERYDYQRYEVSNYAREGHVCRHNLGYWSGIPYIGFGIGAASYFDEVRWKNLSDYQAYLDLDMAAEFDADCPNLRTERQPLSRKEQMEEFMFMGLRRVSGVSALDFKAKFSVDLVQVFQTPLQRYLSQGLMCQSGVHYALSDRGMDVSNIILSDFLLDE